MVSCCEAKDDEFNEFCNIDFQPQTRVSTLKPTSCYRPTRKLQQVRCPSSRHQGALLVPTVHQADISLSVKPISVCPSSRYQDALLVPTVHQADISLSVKRISVCPSSRYQSVRQADITLSIKPISVCPSSRYHDAFALLIPTCLTNQEQVVSILYYKVDNFMGLVTS